MSSLQHRPPVLGESPAIESLRDFIVGVSLRSSPVLLIGPSGVGKSLAAGKIHSIGRFPEIQIEEIDASSISLEQAVAAGGEGRGVLSGGSDRTVHLTRTELMDPAVSEVLEGRICDDLDLPRLIFSAKTPIEAWKNMPISSSGLPGLLARYQYAIPPLRERVEDIPHLCRYRIQTLTEPAVFSDCWSEFSSGYLPGMLAYDWPGNVRELNSEVSRFCDRSTGTVQGTAISTVEDLEKGLLKFRRSMELQGIHRGLLGGNSARDRSGGEGNDAH